MEYFFITTQVVFGILFPGFLFMIISALRDGMLAWRDEAREKDIMYDFLHGQWSFVRKEKCPNPEYIKLIFQHDSTKNLLGIGVFRNSLNVPSPSMDGEKGESDG
jgi:hypothetical protein